MSAGWVAGSVRARAMGRRRIGLPGARDLAGRPSLADAVAALGTSPYGQEVAAGASLADSQRGVAATVLWNMRVLAGWLPAAGVRALRVLAAWFEIANVDQHLRALAGRGAEPPFRLGALATAWPRLSATGSPGQLRAALAASPWGDPGGEGERDIQLGMRLAWADRVRARVPAAAGWARSGAALLVAREVFALGRGLPPTPQAAAVRLLGGAWPGCTRLDALPAALPPVAAGLLRGLSGPDELWRAEARWWSRLRVEGAALLAAPGFAAARPVGAVAMLAGDAWLVRGALEVAARGGGRSAEALHVWEARDALE